MGEEMKMPFSFLVKSDTRMFSSCRKGAIAGLAGGTAEVMWVALYGMVSPTSSAALARGIAATFSPELAANSMGVMAGIAIHMVIALMLGIAVVFAIQPLIPTRRQNYLVPLIVVGLLVGIWAFNFFALLPRINPGFITLTPYGASFASKVLFGIAAASVLLATSEPVATRDAASTSKSRSHHRQGPTQSI
jgi:hypothetical protein